MADSRAPKERFYLSLKVGIASPFHVRIFEIGDGSKFETQLASLADVTGFLKEVRPIAWVTEVLLQNDGSLAVAAGPSENLGVLVQRATAKLQGAEGSAGLILADNDFESLLGHIEKWKKTLAARSDESKTPPTAAELDGRYVPFPPFEKWEGLQIVGIREWETRAERVKEFKSRSPEFFRQAREAVRRAAAVETGAIENLYPEDRGITITIAAGTAAWQEALQKMDPERRGLLEGQFKAYGTVLDFATGRSEILEVWIRQLHEEICAGQESYTVQTDQGPQRRPLVKGAYKTDPNHVYRPTDGTSHAYCPVIDVVPEMERLVKEVNTGAFGSAHPILQAAYAHYALVTVHPFSDGNGRVARALASVFTVRSALVPLLITAEDKPEYIDALEEADAGNGQPLVDFMGRSAIESLRLAEASFDAVEHDPMAQVSRIRSLYITRSGFGIEQLDEAALTLARLFLQALQKEFASLEGAGEFVRMEISHTVSSQTPVARPGYRNPVDTMAVVVAAAKILRPVSAQETSTWHVQIPSNPAGEDELIVLRDGGSNDEAITARVRDLLPSPRLALEMRLQFDARRALQGVLDRAAANAEIHLGRKGYR